LEEEDENLPIQEVSFDPEKAQCCIVENGQILTHGSGGKGYGLASTGVTSGCYQWKVRRILSGCFIVVLYF
jgi:E3 ubiquitin-protein ligase HERC1